MSIKLGIFASGNGSNALNFNTYFKKNPNITVAKIYCNNPSAGIVSKASENDIQLQLFTKEELKSGQLTNQLKKDAIDFVVLAGFLWLIPHEMISQYKDRIINIHPALLPKYGGRGGGKPTFAQGSVAQGTSSGAIFDALAELIREKLGEK